MTAISKRAANPVCVVYGGLSLLRPMHETGIDCHVVSHAPGNVVRYSRKRRSLTHIPSPSQSAEQAVAGLLELGERLGGRPVLYYGNDSTMRLISQHRDTLSEVFRLLMPAANIVADCSDKSRFDAVAEKLGVRYPSSVVAAGDFDEQAVSQLQKPCVIKPILGRDLDRFAAVTQLETRKAVVAETAADVSQVVEQLLDAGVALLIQEFIPGDESNIVSYHAYNDRAYQPLGEFVGRKVRTYPAFGGKSTCLTLIKDEQIVEVGRKIARALQLAGPIKIDFKRNAETGEPCLMEVNTRFTLWNHLGAFCGVNLPLIAYQYLTDRPVTASADYRTDRHWITLADDVRSHIDAHAGRISSIASYPFFRNKPVYHLFAWDDPLPSLIGLKRQLSRRR